MSTPPLKSNILNNISMNTKTFVNILEMVFVFIEILFKILLFKGGVLIYAEHCICEARANPTERTQNW